RSSGAGRRNSNQYLIPNLPASLFVYAGETRRRLLRARCAGELWPLWPLAYRPRTARIRSRVAVDGSQAARRLPILDPFLQRAEAVELRIEGAEAVAKAGDHVESHETVETRLSELRGLLLVIFDLIVWRSVLDRLLMTHYEF